MLAISPLNHQPLENVVINLKIKFMSTSWEIAYTWMLHNTSDDKSTLVQVMAWCHLAPSHYLSQYWPISVSQHGITMPQGVKSCPVTAVTLAFLITQISIDKHPTLTISKFWHYISARTSYGTFSGTPPDSISYKCSSCQTESDQTLFWDCLGCPANGALNIAPNTTRFFGWLM